MCQRERERESAWGVKVSGFPLLLIRDPTRPDPTRPGSIMSTVEKKRGRERERVLLTRIMRGGVST